MSKVEIIARLLIGQYFVIAGFMNIRSYGALLGRVKAKGVPVADIALLCAIAGQIIAPFLLLSPAYAWIGVAFLIAFTVVGTFLFHAFWTMTGVERFLHLNLLMANIGIIGALLLFV
jgi:putative oxidoreductase